MQICGVLGIPWNGDELLALQTSKLALPRRYTSDTYLVTCDTVIQCLEGTVPIVGGPTGGMIRNEQARKSRDARRACFGELARLVGVPGNRVRELKILDNGACSSLP